MMGYELSLELSSAFQQNSVRASAYTAAFIIVVIGVKLPGNWCVNGKDKNRRN